MILTPERIKRFLEEWRIKLYHDLLALYGIIIKIDITSELLIIKGLILLMLRKNF